MAEDLKFRNIEILCEHPFFENWGTDKGDKLKKTLRETMESLSIEVSLHSPYHDLNIATWTLGIRRETINQLKGCVEMADYLNSKIVVVHPGFISSRKFDKQKTFKAMIENFKKVTRLAEDLDITLCLENLARKPKAMGIYPDELLKIVEEVNSQNFEVALDIAHVNASGLNPDNFVKKLKGHISHVHLSDNQGKDDHLPIGLGNIDFKGFLKSLGDYKGLLIIEGWLPRNTDHFLLWSKAKIEEIIYGTPSDSSR